MVMTLRNVGIVLASFVLLFQHTHSLLPLSLGLDFGTSGVRSCVIDSATKTIVGEASLRWNDVEGGQGRVDSAKSWEEALFTILEKTPIEQRKALHNICISGTSSSCLLYDVSTHQVSRSPRLYSYNVVSESSQGQEAMKRIAAVCPPGSAANAATSTLAKLLSWHLERPLLPSERLAHQADFLAQRLTMSSSFISDWHNALKLGFDVAELSYPSWLCTLLREQGITSYENVLPSVIQPGKAMSGVSDEVCRKLGVPATCQVIAGTTDSIAAFLASGATMPGQAVSSLGSTLAVKMLSSQRVDDSARGIYSHRLGDEWLVGGASNVGCAILRRENFSDQELAQLSADIDPNTNIDLQYYPLLTKGERFPVNDPQKMPVLEPKPDTRKKYLHGILQSIAVVERQGYDALCELGASPVTEILTAGGGSKNDMWMKMRQRIMSNGSGKVIKVKRADNVDAAYGVARLACKFSTSSS